MAKAWPLDILTKVTKVVRAPGVSVCGGYAFENFAELLAEGRWRWVIYRSNDNDTWTKVFDEVRSQLYYPWAGAYGLVGPDPGTPTFIMLGQEDYFGTSEDDPPFFKIVILTSQDGESWSETFTETGASGYAAAWDEKNKRFLVESVVDMAPDFYNRGVFASNDGTSWSRIETRPGSELGPEPAPSQLMTDTGTELVQDVNGFIVPRGSYFGENKGATIIAPQALNPYLLAQPASYTEAGVEIIKREIDPESGGETIERSNTSMSFLVASVAYAGGVYHACGSSSTGDGDGGEEGSSRDEESNSWFIASSSDNGETWKNGLEISGHVGICVIAGPEVTK